MVDMSELQHQVSRNVKVLMALRGVRNQAELARLTEFDPTALSKKILGQRPWSLEDIEKLAAEFKVPAGRLLGDTGEFLNPNLRATGTGDMPGANSAYVPAEKEFRLIPFPHVNSTAPELPQFATVTSLASRRPTTSLAVAI